MKTKIAIAEIKEHIGAILNLNFVCAIAGDTYSIVVYCL